MALQDKIGREEIVNKVCGLVDSLQKDQNFCLSINGAWGSGKTFVLQMIEERLAKKQEYIIVKYDAWSNSFYSDPLIAILSCIIDGVDEKLYIVEQYEKKIKSAVKTGANTLAKVSSKISKLKEVVSGIQKIIQNFHNPIDMEIASDFKSYQKLLRETKEVLNEITQKGEYREKQTKLIVLVDEIDRCLPDEQLKILERLHHLFDLKNCVVIAAMNQVSIAQTVQTIYGINGYEYLRKFFNFTFKLETSAANYLQSLFEELEKNFERLQANSSHCIIAIELAYQCLLYGEKHILNKVDNREITRYYNAIINICNDFGWERLTQHYVFFILVGLFIRKEISYSFLDDFEIKKNQEFINKSEVRQNQLVGGVNSEMPYYDYLSHNLGVDRKHPPNEIVFGYGGLTLISQFTWCFNEIVYYSNDKQFAYNEMRIFNQQPAVYPDSCKKLRQLIILYGGEQERCVK